MGEATKIQWTDATFNPWRGCQKVSPGCAHCYAETMSKRNPKVLGEWGPNGTRVIASEAKWREPLKWDREAAAAGVRRKVFCASMADVFEDRPELVAPRLRLFRLIENTPNLDWLLLTKRPENIARMWLHVWVHDSSCPPRDERFMSLLEIGQPSNIWLGTSVEDQATADERIPALLQVPAAVRFISAEPLLGPIDLSNLLRAGRMRVEKVYPDGTADVSLQGIDRIDWVIVGGESGPKARPLDVEWALSIVRQCKAADVPVFCKQLGARPYWVEPLGVAPGSIPSDVMDRYIVADMGEPDDIDHAIDLADPKGGDMDEWPYYLDDLKVRQFPGPARA